MSGSGVGRVVAIRDDALGNTSYLVDVGRGSAIAIDARRDVDDHLQIAAAEGLTIVAALETHLHADFVSGAREIDGAEVVAPAGAALSFQHRPVEPGERFTIGDASVEVIATPGHTPEHVAYLVDVGGDELLFSGGSLIAGGAARTDLSGVERTDQLARAQFQSLRILAALPGDTPLFPTHGGGSFCSTGASHAPATTIEHERATNHLLAIEDEQTFVDELLASFGSYPRYFSYLREVNQKGAPLLRSFGRLDGLDALEARRAVESGTWLIDGRDADVWAAAHAQGSISIAVRPSFASWLGWVVPFGEPVVLMAEPDQVDEAVRLARRIGYDSLRGWVRFTSWRDAGLPVSSVGLVGASEAEELAKEGAVMLDVRQDAEFASGRIPGAQHIELGTLVAGAHLDARRIVTYCGHGERSATAASVLAARGAQVANLQGGLHAWRNDGCPIEI